MKGIGKRLLATVLAVVMVVCGFSHAGGGKSKAAETYSGKLSMTGGQASSGVYPEGDRHGHVGYFYLKGTDALFAGEGEDWGRVLTPQGEDSGIFYNSNIFLNDKKISVNLIKYHGTNNYYYLQLDRAPEDGDRVTIKGNFKIDSYDITFDEVSFIWYEDEMRWYEDLPAKESVVMSFASSGNGAGFYTTVYNDSMPIVSWTDAIWPVVNGDSGLWINDVWYNCPIKRYDEDKYYIGIQDTSYKEAKEGDEVVFKGKYSYDGYIVEFSEVHLTFDGTKWEYVKEVVDGKLTIADAEIQGGGSPSAIYLSGYDTLMHEIEWRVRLDSKSDNNNGILLNGEKMSGGLKKYNKTRYYAEFSEAASVGDIVTIKGEFGNETTNQYINIRETKLRWNGSLWEEVIDNPDESGCEFSAIGLVYNNATQLQLIGNDTHPMTDWTVNFVAAYGDDNGVLFNGVKTDIPMKRIGNSEWFVALGDVGISAKVGDILEVKGTFTSKAYSVNYQPSKYVFDGTKWSKAEEIEYTSFAVTQVLENTAIKDSATWNFYLLTDTELPGDAWANVDGKQEIFALSATLNGTPITLKAKKAGGRDLFIEIPTSQLPADADSVLVVKAGKYKSNVQDIGYELTEDFTLYTNGLGVSLQAPLKSAMDEKLQFKVEAGNASNSEGGFVLSINGEDGMEVGGWGKNMLPVRPGFMHENKTYVFAGVENGVWKGETYLDTDIPIKKLSTSEYYVAIGDRGYQAAIGDVFTVKGLYYDGTGRIVEWEPISVTWDGSKWSKVYTGINYTNVNVKNLSTTGGYNEGSQYWDLYLTMTGEIPGTSWTTVYEGLEVYLGDKKLSPTLKCADSTNINFYMTVSEGFSAPADIPVGTKLTVKAGQAVGLENGFARGDGIQITEDFVLEWTGSAWSQVKVDETVYTSFAVTQVLKETSISGGATWNFYLLTDTELPGDAWANVDGKQEIFALSATLNGTPVTLNAKKAGGRDLFIEIPTSQLPADADSVLVVKAGKYKSNVQDIGYELTEDFTLYTNELGVSLQAPLKSAMDTKLQFKVETGNASNSEGGFVLSINGEDGMEVGGWGKNMLPVRPGFMHENKTYVFAGVENGVWKGETYLDTDIPIKKISTSEYYVAIGDRGYTAAAGDVFTIKGLYYDQAGRIVEWQPISVTYDGSKWSQVYTDIEYTAVNVTGSPSGGYSDANKYWDMYFDMELDGELPGTAWEILYEGLEVYLGDKKISPSLKKAEAKKMNLFMTVADGFSASGDIPVGTKLTIKAGEAVGLVNGFASGTGIRVTKDFVLEWSGNAWTTGTVWTPFALSGLSSDTQCTSGAWHAYFETDATLPGDNWATVNGVTEAYSLDVIINGEPATVKAKKAGSKTLFLEFATSLLAAGEEATFVVKAGKYRSNAQAIGLQITSDFTIYINKYGWSTKGFLKLGMSRKPQFTVQQNAPSATANGFVLKIDEPDGTPEAVGWDTRLMPVVKSLSEDAQTLYYAPTMENGILKNGVHLTTTAEGGTINRAPIVKLNENEYYIGIGDWGYTAADGDRFTFGGVCYDSNGRLVEYKPITVKYNGATGKWEAVYTPLADSGVVNDINADGDVDSRDLVRFMLWDKNSMTSINDTRADVNMNGKTNAKDIASMRKILVGKLFYNGVDKVPYGVPSYAKNDKVMKAAYSSPRVGTWDSSTQTYTRLDEAVIDANFEKFKAAGLNTLLSEHVAMLTVEAWDHASNQAIKEYLLEAEQHGLDVIVFCEYLEFCLKGSVDMTEVAQGTLREFRWQELFDYYISCLSVYPAFKGFMMSDELPITYIENYEAIATFFRTQYPGLVMFSSQYPTDAYDLSGGPNLLTTNTSVNNTEQLAYRDYVYRFGMASGHFTWDLYPLTVKKAAFTDKETYSVNDSWFKNLKWVAEEKKENNYAFTSGVTIQSCALPQDSTNWWQSTVDRYAPEARADIGFQVYTALAYGARDIDYFTYEPHWQANITDAMTRNANVYNAVKTVNNEVDKFGHVYMAFDWKETLDIAKGSSGSTALSPRLANASVTGYRAFVGCFQDEEGYDGYMIASAAGPQTSDKSTITLKFNNATKAIVYKNGVKSVVTLGSDGSYTISNLAAGEGVFVIPYREKKN